MDKPKGTPTSFDIIGDILILEIPEGVKNEKKIAQYFLEKQKNVKVIAKKFGKHSGTYRTQKLRILAGERRKKTLYTESGVRMQLHVENTYFSPRLSTERARVASLVKPGEDVLVMFSGIAPYPLVIAKHSKAKSIVGIEINPKSHADAEVNVKLNKFTNIKVYLGDVHKVLPKLKKKFDRIIMPLPKTADEFLEDAKKVSKKGTTIHFYTIEDFDKFQLGIDKVKNVFPKAKNIKVVKCGQYSPRTFRISIDFKLP